MNGRFLASLLVAVSSAHAAEFDVNGSWQLVAPPACGSTINVAQIVEDTVTGAFTSTTTDCGTVAGALGVARLSGCTMDPVAGQVAGTSFATPPTGLRTGELLIDPPAADPGTGCGSTPVSRIVAESRLDGTITDDGAGLGVRVDGQATVGVVTAYDAMGQVCDVTDYGSVPICGFVMLRNDVRVGTQVRVEPTVGASVTFATVTGAGTATITPLTTPDGSLPAEFRVLDVPLYFDVTTTADVSGPIEVCLPYPDQDADGFVDGTTPAIPESDLLLLHEEGGTFVDRTTSRDTGNNVICAATASLSQFVQGAAASTSTTSTTSTSTTSTTLPPAELIPGRAAIVKPDTLAKFVAKPATGDTFALPSANPLAEGGSLRVFDTSGSGGDDTYSLPPGVNWKALGDPPGAKGWKYTGAGTPGDPCKVVVVKEALIAGACKGTGITLAPPFTGDVGVILSLGTTDRYCARFGGHEAKNDATLTKRKNAPAPGACP